MNEEWIKRLVPLLKRASLDKNASVCIVLSLGQEKDKEEERANNLIDFLIKNPNATEEEIFEEDFRILGFPINDDEE